MSKFTKSYQAHLQREWNKYIKAGVKLPEKNIGIRDFIFDSWKRSQSYNVNPFEVKDKRLSSSELLYLQEKNEGLIFTAHSYIQHLYRFIRGSNFILALTDVEGYVLDLIGDDDMIRGRAKKSGLSVGCCRSEQYSGTNGIGTCLKEGKAIQIWGEEHFIAPHHNYVCSAAPIHNERGEIIGCLDMVGPVEVPHTHTLAMVSASVDGIEKELKIKRAYEEITVANRQMDSTIQAIPSGILMINPLGIITQHNEKACDILGLPRQRLSGHSLSDFIQLHASGLDLTDINRDIQYREITIVTKNNFRLSLNLSASVVSGTGGEKHGTVLVLDELKKLHKLTNNISGFTATYTFDSLLGQSQAISEVKQVAKVAAQGNANVLILGESGTGKELLAQSIHNAGIRSGKPFIAINCGSMPKGLIESELFGYEKGAFTGANKNGQPGKFELADGGTIFLDEIGDMPLELQTSLFRVLQSKKIIRIGGKQEKEIDVRIIAATNTNLLEAVKEKAFREELYYRLNVLSVDVPPLRERREDIPLLVCAFIEDQNKVLGKNIQGLTEEAREKLLIYPWPGNIRELENVIERAMNLAQSHMLTVADLPAVITSAPAAPAPKERTTESANDILMDALRQARGNVSKVSERLGIPKRTLYRRIQKYGIDVDQFRI
jgi:PAS domain S-box-containing protein